MQTFSHSKKLSLALMLCISAAPIIGEDAKKPFEPLVPTSKFTRVVGTSLLTATVITFLRLLTKKTAPKRVLPKDDSLLALLWYYFDELLVGQMEKGERPEKLVIDEEAGELIYKYSKIEARGLAGVLYSILKPVIIPTATLLVLLKANVKDIYCGVLNFKDFAENPFTFFQLLHEKCNNQDVATSTK